MVNALIIGTSVLIAVPASLVLWCVYGKEPPYAPLSGADAD